MSVATRVDVVMPQMGVSVTEGTVSRWVKQIGDHVAADETIVEISTDKVDAEVPSPASGRLVEILISEGTTVDVGTPIAVLDTGGGVGGAAPAASVEAETAPPSADGGGEPAAADVAVDETATTDGTRRAFMSPVVARMVSEHDLDIAVITGTGQGGRVTKKDVETFLAARDGAPVVAPTPTRPLPPPPRSAPPVPPAPGQPAPSAQPTAPVAPATAGSGEEIYRFSTIRKAIARHMREARETQASITSISEVDMTRVVEYRRQLKAEFQTRHGVGLSFMPFIFKATIDAIGKWPWVNAEIVGEEAIIKRYVNLGVAVSVDNGEALLVPVIRNAESLSLVGLARALTEVADKARRKVLTIDEMSGGTFTITNPGVFGPIMGTPIIPVGQTAIMDVEAIVKRPVVVTDEFGNDQVAIRSIMYLPITVDHRLVDGAYVAQFARDVKKNLETWPVEAYIG